MWGEIPSIKSLLTLRSTTSRVIFLVSIDGFILGYLRVHRLMEIAVRVLVGACVIGEFICPVSSIQRLYVTDVLNNASDARMQHDPDMQKNG